MITLDDTTFNKTILKSRLPAIVCFGASWCEDSQALGLSFERLAAEYTGRLVAASVDADVQTILVTQFGITTVPTLSVFNAGDEVLRSVGYYPAGLLRRLFDHVLEPDGIQRRMWLPTEQEFEDAVVAPMLTNWGFSFARQLPCGKGRGAARRLADFVVYDGASQQAFTLFECKRRIGCEDDLQRACAQAAGYARALDLPSFVDAAPQGMWVYGFREQRAWLERAFRYPDAPEQRDALHDLLLGLR